MISSNGKNDEAIETCKTICEAIFRDCHENGFSRGLATGYNMLLSAARYLDRGEPMPASRTQKFFQEAA